MNTRLKVKDVLGLAAGLWLDRGYDITHDIAEADIVCLNGGSDIATEIYGQREVRHYHRADDNGDYLGPYPTLLSNRDKMEIHVYKQARAAGKFIVGICRGAQLVTCMEGGSLWQHVNNHSYTHPIMDLVTGKMYRSTSVHHQMMRPPSDAQVIAVASESTFKMDANGTEKCVVFGTDLKDGKDPEIVWYPKVRALCIQGHPEYAPQSLFADYCFELIDELRVNGVWTAPAATKLAAL